MLNIKSDFSLLWGTRSPGEVVRKAVELGYEAVALADRDNLYGLPAFLAKAKLHGVRPIVAAEVTDPITRQSALLYPMTKTGYGHLCRILTERHCRNGAEFDDCGEDPEYQDPRCQRVNPPVSPLTKGGRRGVLAASHDEGACPCGRGHATQHSPPDAFNLERALYQYGDGLAIVTDSLRIMRRLAGREHVYVRMGHRLTRPPAEVRHLPCAIVPPAVFFDRNDLELHRLMRAIHLKQRLSLIPQDALEDERSTFEPWDVIRSRFAALPQAIEGTQRLLDALRLDNDFSEILFPDFPAPPGMSVIDLLRCKTYEGARKRYGLTPEDPRARILSRTHGRGNPFPRGSQDGNPAGCGCEIGISHQIASHQDAGSAGASPSPLLPPAVVDRIERELDLIEQKGFAPYFLVVEEIVRRSPRTCGRGSAAASIVSYALGITNVDPIRHNLFFERFLNPGRIDPPDIDVDFAWDERDEVLEWVLNHYGTDRAAMVANHLHFRPRMALRETARVFGIPEGEIGTVTKRLPWGWQTDDEGALDAIVRDAPRMADVNLDPPWPDIIRLAGRLIGKPRGLSVHCGGVLLTPGQIWERSPIQPSAKGVNISHWDKDGVEDMGLVKIDLLGNRSLAVIRDAIANLRDEGVAIDEDRWDPIGDPETQAMLASGKTMGVFYCESPAMRQLQIKTGRGDFEHLVINTSIIRPAANAYTTEYVKRVHGIPYEPVHPLLTDILDETYGIMVYQEDVSRVAMAMAGFSCEDADRLRKIMSKKDKELELAHFYRQFVEGARAKGVGDAVIDEVFKMILAFSGYSFCKPHSASYTMVSYESAYLKAHHPAEFMAAVMANHGGYYSTQAYVSEARRLGVDVLRPDINLSERKFIARDGHICTGLAEIKGLSLAAQERIIEERKRNGPFASLADFLARTGITHADAKRLILVGALDAVEPTKNRPTLLWELKVACGTAAPGDRDDHDARARIRSNTRARILSRTHERGNPFPRRSQDRNPAECGCKIGISHQKDRNPGECGWEMGISHQTAPTPTLQPYSRRRTLELEYDLLGFLCTAHPLEVFRPSEARDDWIKADRIAEHIGRTVRILSWPISSKTITTVHGEHMEFVSFEDETDLYEAVLFPRQYRRFANLLFCDFPVIVTGKVDEDFGALSVLVNHIARA